MHDAIEMSGDSGVILEERLSRDLEVLRAVTEEQLPSLGETEHKLRAHVRRHRVLRHRAIVAGGLAAACSTALAAPWFLGSPEPSGDAVSSRAAVAGNASRPIDGERVSAAQATQALEARAKRDALQREIVRRTSARPTSDAAAARAVANSTVSSYAMRDAHEEREREPRSTDLKNKLGPAREKLVKFLNDEFSPLLAECVEQAEARSPNVTGVFAIGIETLAYEELGAIVDSADPTGRNEIADPQFIECVRESAFTLIIPPPLTTGQEKFELNGYVGARR